MWSCFSPASADQEGLGLECVEESGLGGGVLGHDFRDALILSLHPLVSL